MQSSELWPGSKTQLDLRITGCDPQQKIRANVYCVSIFIAEGVVTCNTLILTDYVYISILKTLSQKEILMEGKTEGRAQVLQGKQ